MDEWLRANDAKRWVSEIPVSEPRSQHSHRQHSASGESMLRLAYKKSGADATAVWTEHNTVHGQLADHACISRPRTASTDSHPRPVQQGRLTLPRIRLEIHRPIRPFDRDSPTAGSVTPCQRSGHDFIEMVASRRLRPERWLDRLDLVNVNDRLLSVAADSENGDRLDEECRGRPGALEREVRCQHLQRYCRTDRTSLAVTASISPDL